MIKKQFNKAVNINSITMGSGNEGDFLQVRIIGNENTSDLKGRYLSYLNYIFDNMQRLNGYTTVNDANEWLTMLLESEVILEETQVIEGRKILTILYHRNFQTGSPSKTYNKFLNIMTTSNGAKMNKINGFGQRFKIYSNPVAFQTDCPALKTENNDLSIEFSSMYEVGGAGTYVLVVPEYSLNMQRPLIEARMRFLEKFKKGNLYIKTVINPQKEITSGGKTYMDFIISDDLLDLLNDRIAGELYIMDFEFVHTCYVGKTITRHKNGQSITKWMGFKGKNFKYIREQNIIICYDGKKAKDIVVSHMNPLWKERLEYLVVTQYGFSGSVGDYYAYSNPAKTGYIDFINKKDVEIYPEWDGRNRNNDMIPSIDMVVHYRSKEGRRVTTIVPVRIQNGTSLYGNSLSWIVPYEDDESANKYIHFLSECISDLVELLDYSLKDYYNYYKSKTIIPLQENEVEDILENWYKTTLKRQKQEKDNVSRAYIQMRNNLINEQRTLRDYLKVHDFSKLNPVPKIEIDEKTLKNYYKTLHIEPKDIIINSINNKRINPIRRIKGVTKIMFVNHGRVSMNVVDLDNFYDRQTNRITLTYSGLKGAIKNDKA